MKIKQKLFAAALAVSAFASAQEAPTFSLSGQFRPRTEYLGSGFGSTVAEGTDGFIQTTVRAELAATYKTEGYTLFTSLRDVFTLGDRHQIENSDDSKLRVQEAWADIVLAENFNLKVGRQAISYDDQRILGGLDWAQQGRTHDVAIFKYKKDGYSLDLGYGLNTIGSTVTNTSENYSYREMAFAHANKKYGAFNISALVLANTFQDETGEGNKKTFTKSTGVDDKSTLLTAGLYADYTVDAFTFNASAYIQDGERIFGGVHQDIEGASLLSLNAKYAATKKTSFGLGFESISGKDDGDNSKGFFPLYGTNHKFNGYMDRFFVGNHSNANGLNDAQASISTKIAGAAVSLTGHYFTEQSESKDDLGTELDLVIAKKFNGFKLVGGYSQFFEPSEVTGDKSTQNWAWLMLVIKPKFL